MSKRIKDFWRSRSLNTDPTSPAPSPKMNIKRASSLMGSFGSILTISSKVTLEVCYDLSESCLSNGESAEKVDP